MTAHTENSLALDTSSQRVALRCGTNLASDTLGPAMGEPPPQTPLPRPSRRSRRGRSATCCRCASQWSLRRARAVVPGAVCQCEADVVA
jgi:hypothetical protein